MASLAENNKPANALCDLSIYLPLSYKILPTTHLASVAVVVVDARNELAQKVIQLATFDVSITCPVEEGYLALAYKTCTKLICDLYELVSGVDNLVSALTVLIVVAPNLEELARRQVLKRIHVGVRELAHKVSLATF